MHGRNKPQEREFSYTFDMTRATEVYVYGRSGYVNFGDAGIYLEKLIVSYE